MKLGRLLLVVAPLWALARPDGAEPDRLVLEDFEDNPVGAFPADWDVRGWGRVSDRPYRVLEEAGNRFLRAEDSGQNVVLVKRPAWNLHKYPFLSWRWRIRAVPAGSDERSERWVDSAAGLYVTFGRKLGLVPQSIKWVWSERISPGSAFRRSGLGMPWTVVAGGGPALPDQWLTYVYDVRECYRQTFGGEPGERVFGIALLSDANNTGGRASADYDDLVALKHAPAAARIVKLIAAE
jgi:hypothetical protein